MSKWWITFRKCLCNWCSSCRLDVVRSSSSAGRWMVLLYKCSRCARADPLISWELISLARRDIGCRSLPASRTLRRTRPLRMTPCSHTVCRLPPLRYLPKTRCKDGVRGVRMTHRSRLSRTSSSSSLMDTVGGVIGEPRVILPRDDC